MGRRLAAAGCKLALIDMDEDALAGTAADCSGAGATDVRTYTVNVAREGEVEALFTAIADDFGELHGLINNAGITRDGRVCFYVAGKRLPG